MVFRVRELSLAIRALFFFGGPGFGVYICASLLHLAVESRDLSQFDKRTYCCCKLSKLLSFAWKELPFCEFTQLYITVKPNTSARPNPTSWVFKQFPRILFSC